jgi:hypothetical protein
MTVDGKDGQESEDDHRREEDAPLQAWGEVQGDGG